MKKIYLNLLPKLIKAFIYCAILAAITAGIMILSEESFKEDNAVEWLQFTFLFIATLCFIFTGKQNHDHRALSFVLAGVFLAACVRECDRILDEHVFEHAWKVGVTLIMIYVAWLICRKTQSIAESTIIVMQWSSFGILLAGFMVLVYSRIFGHNDFWTIAVSRSNHKMFLRVLEEGIELLAYYIFLIGAIEYQCAMRRLKKHPDCKQG